MLQLKQGDCCKNYKIISCRIIVWKYSKFEKLEKMQTNKRSPLWTDEVLRKTNVFAKC